MCRSARRFWRYVGLYGLGPSAVCLHLPSSRQTGIVHGARYRLGSAELYKIDRTTAAMVPIAILPREQSSLDEIWLPGRRATDSRLPPCFALHAPDGPYVPCTGQNSALLHPERSRCRPPGSHRAKSDWAVSQLFKRDKLFKSAMNKNILSPESRLRWKDQNFREGGARFWSRLERDFGREMEW
jgi:hypothetical protein